MDDESREKAFERLYGHHHREVLAYCARRVPRADAFDATAEVFLVAWRRLEEIPQPDQALPWLYGVAHRVLSNQWRSRDRGRRLGLKLRWIGGDKVVDPATQLVQREEERQVIAAAQQLKPHDREILLLSVWEELKPEQIAAALGISRDAVDQRLHRAKARLSREFQRITGTPHATPQSQPKGGVA